MEIEEKSKKWFQEVFDKNYEYIRNYLYYLSADIKLSEDLVQDVFLKLWEKRDSVRNETVRPFLFKLAKNAYLKNVRTKKSDLKFRTTYLKQVENESPEYILELKEFDKKVQQTIAGLPEKCRAMYLMSRIDNMTYNEIAESLNISVKAVEKQISKALAIFRKKLGVRM